MSVVYEKMPFTNIKRWAEETGLTVSYHPLRGAGFMDRDGNVVGWTPPDAREMARFLDAYREGKPMYGAVHAARLLEAQAGALLRAAELLEAMEEALGGFDVEFYQPAPGQFVARLWRDGEMEMEVGGNADLGALLRRALQEVKDAAV